MLKLANANAAAQLYLHDSALGVPRIGDSQSSSERIEVEVAVSTLAKTWMVCETLRVAHVEALTHGHQQPRFFD